MKIETFTAAGFEQNGYIAWGEQSSEAVAIDPGGDSIAMADLLDKNKLQLAAILLTHAHIDHIEGIAPLMRRSPAPVYLHPDDKRLYDAAALQAAQFGVHMEPLPPINQALEDNQQLTFGTLQFEVRHVPGHSPGHVLFYDQAAAIAFVGDLVFQGSIGRSDLPGGNLERLMRSIRERVLTMPDSTMLYSGHGPRTTVGHERLTNPFLIPNFRGGFA